MTVGPDGRFTWHVNPSTRPVVMDRQVETVSGEPVAEESWTGTTAPLQSTDQEFTVDRDVDLLEIDLDWPTPDDLDLEVYRKNADGSLTPVGSSGNAVAEKERVLLQDPAQGTYVLRVHQLRLGDPELDADRRAVRRRVLDRAGAGGELDADLRAERPGRRRPCRSWSTAASSCGSTSPPADAPLIHERRAGRRTPVRRPARVCRRSGVGSGRGGRHHDPCSVGGSAPRGEVGTT